MIDTILNTELKFTKGVGIRKAMLLESELCIANYGDLLTHIPIRYIDRTKLYKISDITESNENPFIQFRAKLLGFSFAGAGRKQRLSAEVADNSGFANLLWFQRMSWVQKSLEVGREYIFFGRPSFYNGSLSLIHPEFEPVGLAAEKSAVGVEGIYSTTDKLTSEGMGSKALSRLVRQVWTECKPYIRENLPDYVIQSLNLIPRVTAYEWAHFPESNEALQKAIYRLKMEELLTLQIGMIQNRRERHSNSSGYIFSNVGSYFNRFYGEKLPFPLTGAQKRVFKELRGDMGSGRQMNRLLQGDVGSGKTIVGLMCMILALDNNFQSALMAPTEILAQQHFRSISEQCEGLGINIAILTGSTRKKAREKILDDLAAGRIAMLIGTHALIEDPVQFYKLGLVIIDEQHRFGVKQRAKLWGKSIQAPHILVMTATPIPRTLAMTVYGDLDVSKIDELPPGRKPIQTFLIKEGHRLRMIGFIKEQIAKGRQAYLVYPLIKESETMDYSNLEQGAEMILHHFPAPEYATVVVHGQMSNDDKDYGMRLFASGKVQILISTTVIEVGVNVPNASVMVIESAERFGLSQLHQLRGRVGRGSDQSYCILMSGDKTSSEAERKLEAMCRTTDGFELAELDMEIRGIGDIEGTRQSGQAMNLRVANLSKDTELLELANTEAERILDADPRLDHPLNKPLKDLVDKMRISRGGSFSLSQIS